MSITSVQPEGTNSMMSNSQNREGNFLKTDIDLFDLTGGFSEINPKSPNRFYDTFDLDLTDKDLWLHHLKVRYDKTGPFEKKWPYDLSP